MTELSDETLMAFADGELEPSAQAAVQAAMRADPAVALRIEQHRALRARLQRSFATELAEPLPERLLAAARGVRGAGSAGVSVLVAARDARDARDALDSRDASDDRVARRGPGARRWRPLAAMAACLLIGVGVGVVVLRHPEPFIGSDGGALVAKGGLAAALSSQLGADRSAAGAVQIGLSFVNKSGEYCRVFNLSARAATQGATSGGAASSGAAASSGVACHRSDDWQIRALAQSLGSAGMPHSGADYRTAGSSLPSLILDAVQQQIAGEPLDLDAEAAARRRGWQGAAH